jgi:hypothetical protein
MSPSPNPPQAFALMDTSGDGELSRSEVRSLAITPIRFPSYLPCGDGELPRSEVSRRLGLGLGLGLGLCPG